MAALVQAAAPPWLKGNCTVERRRGYKSNLAPWYRRRVLCVISALFFPLLRLQTGANRDYLRVDRKPTEKPQFAEGRDLTPVAGNESAWGSPRGMTGWDRFLLMSELRIRLTDLLSLRTRHENIKPRGNRKCFLRFSCLVTQMLKLYWLSLDS